jgi:hypothetical protein
MQVIADGWSCTPGYKAMTDHHPFDVFKNPSSLYKYQIRPNGSRVLSVPDSSDPDSRERALVNFQPTAKRALRIVDQHDVNIRKPKTRLSRSGARLIELIIADPL